MSIMGAATAGVIASGIIIKFQKEVYDKKISELQGYASELEDHLLTLEGYKNEIRRFWEDEDADKYIRVVETQIAQIRVAKTRIDGLSSLYETLKDKLDASHNMVSEKIDEISGIIGALTGLSE